MTDREKLTQLIYDNPEEYLSEGTCRETADHLLANGVTFASAVPGPSDADPNIMELCFHNGERHMKEKVLSSLDRIDKDYTLEDAFVDYERFRKAVEDL